MTNAAEIEAAADAIFDRLAGTPAEIGRAMAREAAETALKAAEKVQDEIRRTIMPEPIPGREFPTAARR